MRTWLYVYSLFPFPLSELFVFSVSGTHPTAGVPDMTVISDIDELGIKQNLQVRYSRNQIYVSFITCRVDFRRFGKLVPIEIRSAIEC